MKVIDLVREALKDICEGDTPSSLTPTKVTQKQMDFIESLFYDENSNDANENDELDRYIRSEFRDIPLDINEFWKQHQKAFPKLAQLAKKLLSLPASTAANERSFSNLRYLLTDQRENLSASTISSIFITDSISKQKICYNRDG